MDFTVFQERLRTIMESRGVSMLALGDYLNISPSTISRYLSGRRTPDLPYIMKLSEFFNVSIDWLLGLNGDKFEVLPKDIQDLAMLYTVASPDDRRVIQAVLQKYKDKE